MNGLTSAFGLIKSFFKTIQRPWANIRSSRGNEMNFLGMFGNRGTHGLHLIVGKAMDPEPEPFMDSDERALQVMADLVPAGLFADMNRDQRADLLKRYRVRVHA